MECERFLGGTGKYEAFCSFRGNGGDSQKGKTGTEGQSDS